MKDPTWLEVTAYAGESQGKSMPMVSENESSAVM